LNPILRTHPGSPLIGPGHQSTLEIGGNDYIFFHGWNRNPDADDARGRVLKRCLYVSRIEWEGRSGQERLRVTGGASTSSD
jgi:hypothetical protein